MRAALQRILAILHMPCYSPLQGYRDYITNGLTFDHRKGSQTLEVACGQCLGCRVDHRLMWSIRIIHEASLHIDNYGNSWATLTYRDPDACDDHQYKNGYHIPEKPSLTPSHVSDFIRSLRKANKDHKIRYFYCGEYGELGRPHYHICIFNHSFDDKYLWKDDEGVYTYTSTELEKHWPYGFTTVAPLTMDNAAYTAGYAFKKITGKRAQEHYLRWDEHGEAYWLLPEYIRMSTGRGKPSGLGAKFYEKFTNDIFPADISPVPGHGQYELVPRYYQNILAEQNPEMLEEIKTVRQKFITAHAADFTPERLRDKYICARAKENLKTRTLP